MNFQAMAKDPLIKRALLVTADLLTGFRVAVAVAIIAMGVIKGRAALPWVVILTMLAWMGDFFDGKAARLASGGSAPKTLFGKYDFVVDVSLTAATLVYLGLAGFIPILGVVLYITVATAAGISSRGAKTVVVAFMRPIDLTAGFIAFYYYPKLFLVFLVWLFLALVWNWKRVKVGVPYFFKDMKARIFGNKVPDLPSRETWGELHEKWPWEDEETRQKLDEWKGRIKSSDRK